MKRSTIHIQFGPTGTAWAEQFQYPAGEWQVRIRPEFLENFRQADAIDIRANLCFPDSLMRLMLLRSAIRGLTPAPVDLYIPYLNYGRADRPFTAGDCHGLGTFVDVLTAGGAFRRIRTLDAHSDVSKPWGIENIPPTGLIARAVSRFAAVEGRDNLTILFPDQGARARYADLPGYLKTNVGGIDIRWLECSKRRDAVTGKLLGFNVPAKEITWRDDVLIVDDICDGGGTFLGIADQLGGKCLLGLYVTHGIFSKGFDDLRKRFKVIYCSDSLDPVLPQDLGVVFPVPQPREGE